MCSQSLGTLPVALQKTAAQFEHGGNELQLPLATLNDLRARLRSLTDKLENQHAYLLIFGPLKSGKSTLMNAISGAYVSEVTSLPGYPCLVFVQDSDSARYSVTRYNGRESVFASGLELKSVVEDAHRALADQIRAAEEREEAFDPGTSFPEAIRRVDIKLPVPALGESAMVLVDTPGLYSRMNFGYDVLTREFRHSAACAVFVVKTDNLFLEQVFAEFTQLLGLFSRIFIVVNVDVSKRDLAPDGSLRPSAESENPERVLEAFKTLSMAGPLRAAYDSGRVRIHAVDLLHAASTSLSRADGNDFRLPTFDAFQNELTEYLNSTDYTREFIRDSLRQARTLCGEMQATISGAEVTAMRSRQEALGAEIGALDVRLAATDRLLRAD
ncbi:MAG TPA: dynamin family protein, partial [Burkholderiales bacterium]|nr:dynamin family protein [Burkholderiales bacterium]